MKRLIIAILIVPFSFVKAQAQEISSKTFGIKAGANFSNLRSTDGNNSESADMKVGLHGGVFLNIPVGSIFSINPEVIYSLEGAKDNTDDSKINLNYLNIPILLQYNNESGVFIETGPQIGFLFSAKARYAGTSVDLKDQLEKTNLSWCIGAGYKLLSGVGFNARYNLGLSNIAKNATGDPKTKNNAFQLSLFKSFQ